MQLVLAKSPGNSGDDLKTWTLDGLKASAHSAYDEKANTFRPVQATGDKRYLTLADRVADNILASKRLNNFFIDDRRYVYANIDNIAPYALLALEAAHRGKPDTVAAFINGAGFTEGAYLMADGSVRYSTRDDELFTLQAGEQLKPNGKK
ncbi:hypothetical protein PU683_04320 [Kosakonia cowanii]|uniref:hypothetical protein n=1 Tax=Kosakonia cowanii TaxID=208223 RepID=UPI0023F7FC65|nr:hypothetical protein [Kosakonia cowanii]MDF7758763.1 hypothetical protein [Kosakonia cowanii]